MGDCKRCAPTIAAMEEVSSSGPTISKKRKTIVSAALKLRSSDLPNFHDISVSPESSVNSAGTVVSCEFWSDRSPLSCCSSSYVIETGEVVKELDTKPLDLEVWFFTKLWIHEWAFVFEYFGFFILCVIIYIRTFRNFLVMTFSWLTVQIFSDP